VKETDLDEVRLALSPEQRARFEAMARDADVPAHAWHVLPGLRSQAELAAVTAVASGLTLRYPDYPPRQAMEDAARSLGADLPALLRRQRVWRTLAHRQGRKSGKTLSSPDSAPEQHSSHARGQGEQGAAFGDHARVDASERGAPPPTSWMD
jgi:hypothetical protein